MSNKPAPTELVQSMYAAFGRGDIPALLAGMADNVAWHINVDPSAPGVGRVDAFREFQGPTGVADFFAGLARDLEFHSFQPETYFTAGNEVAVRVRMEWTVRATKRRLRVVSMHVFRFDLQGRLARFDEFSDTLSVAGAWGAIRAAE